MTARILIVDDIAAYTRLLQAKLSAEYYQVAVAHDGETALELTLSWQPDLVLLDVMMPGIDGYETCRRLKADPRTIHIPVIMVTALHDPIERLHGLQAGADDFLAKPVQYGTLLARMRGLIRFKRTLDELRARAQTMSALGLAHDLAVDPPMAGARALVIDDWDPSARDAETALARDSIVVARARSETEALGLVQADGPGKGFDLIVLSLSLTGGDPLRLASRLLAEPMAQATPLLLIAEPEQRERLLRGFDLGANDWLLRPVDQNELQARARNQIRRKLYQDRLRTDFGHALELAVVDPLTGLYNQRYLKRHLRGLLETGQAMEIAALMIDIDHFKAINDRWGHAAGDEALRQVASLLRGQTRAFDSIARTGGEEFVIVMPGASAQDAMSAAERLRKAAQTITIEASQAARNGLRDLTISIGVAHSATGGITPDQLLELADRALYRAKRSGRNRVEIAPAT